MSRLDTLLQELCPDGVEYRTVSSFSNVLRGKRLTKSQLQDDGEYPVFHGGLEPLGFYTLKNREANSVMIINVGASAGTIGYCEKEFWSSDGCFCIEKTDAVDDRFLYHYLKNNEHYFQSKVRKAGIPTLDNYIVEQFEIPVPPLEVQQEIVRMLDKFTQLKAELSAEISARRIQYEHYRNELLTFGDDVPLKSIGEICSVSAGGDAPKDAMSKKKEEGFEIPIVSNGIGDNALYGYTNMAKITEPAVTVAARGTIGYAEYRDYPYYPIIRLLTVMPKNNKEVHTKYLYYCLAGKEYSIPQGGIPQLTAPMLKKELIPIPSIDKQKEIIRILDRFNCITTDIYSGIPAEIEARTKQYEFYRDKLLSFKRKEVS